MSSKEHEKKDHREPKCDKNEWPFRPRVFAATRKLTLRIHVLKVGMIGRLMVQRLKIGPIQPIRKFSKFLEAVPLADKKKDLGAAATSTSA